MKAKEPKKTNAGLRSVRGITATSKPRTNQPKLTNLLHAGEINCLTGLSFCLRQLFESRDGRIQPNSKSESCTHVLHRYSDGLYSDGRRCSHKCGYRVRVISVGTPCWTASPFFLKTGLKCVCSSEYWHGTTRERQRCGSAHRVLETRWRQQQRQQRRRVRTGPRAYSDGNGFRCSHHRRLLRSVSCGTARSIRAGAVWPLTFLSKLCPQSCWSGSTEL